MDAIEAIMSRRSVRKFLPTPVPMDSLRRILEAAGRAPSGHNIQPWHVYAVTGAVKDDITADILTAIAEEPAEAHQPEFDYYPIEWHEPYDSRRKTLGFALYSTLGIERGDKAARAAQMNRNFMFFDAPVGLFVTLDRRLATGSYMDIGMFIENILIAARGEGLHSCGQAAFNWYHKVIGQHLPMRPEEQIACGISLGYEDPEAPENKLRADKLPLDDYATFLGF